jgi:hypothetical protein
MRMKHDPPNPAIQRTPTSAADFDCYSLFQLVSAPRGCTRDEGRPLGVGLQEQAPNRLKLHGSRALVVSVEGKDMAMTMSGAVQGDERKRTTDEVSK